MYPPKLFPGLTIQSRSAARRAAQDLVGFRWFGSWIMMMLAMEALSQPLHLSDTRIILMMTTKLNWWLGRMMMIILKIMEALSPPAHLSDTLPIHFSHKRGLRPNCLILSSRFAKQMLTVIAMMRMRKVLLTSMKEVSWWWYVCPIFRLKPSLKS